MMTLTDRLKYCYHWTVFNSVYAVRRLVLSMLPVSYLEARIKQMFDPKLIKVTRGEENAGKYDKKTYKTEVVVKDPRFYHRMAIDGALALGEAYMEGWIEYEDTYDFHCYLLRNYNKDEEVLDQLVENLLHAKNHQTREMSHQVVDAHYDLGNELYTAMLGPTMNYTCAYWKEDTKTLEEAQINKMDLVARKLKLKPGMKVLDIGCGWGGAAKYMAENYKVSVVGYTISEEQIKFAREWCKGLDVEFRMQDYRDAEGEYDAVYSIGLMEAVGTRNYREYFEVVDRCLKDGGLHLLHSIVMKDRTFNRLEPWSVMYIFPGCELPYPDEFFTYSAGLFVVEDVHNFGYSYKLTLMKWIENFTKNWPELKPRYGGLVNGQFYRMWMRYLNFAAALFETRTTHLYQVVMSKKGVKGGYVSVR